MIEDARKIPAGTTLDADLCLIGAGPAAITIALQMIGTPLQVILLVVGARKETTPYRDLYRGHVDPPSSHEPLEENRPRVLGGGTTIWGSRCVPLDPVDFAKRSWVPHSGWPFEYSALLPFYPEANRLCETGDFSYDARHVFPSTAAEMIPGIDGVDLATWPLERWGPPTDFGQRYFHRLSSASNIRVLLHGHAVHLQADVPGTSLCHVDCACLPGAKFRVRARKYILACGGIENARLLLSSDDVSHQGLGNTHDLVGRFYQSHLFGVHAWANLVDPYRSFIYDFERDPAGVYCRRRFWMTPVAQEKYAVGNAIGFFFRPPLGSAVHRDALFSATFLGKFLVGRLKRGGWNGLLRAIKSERQVLAEHLGVTLRDAPHFFPQALRLLQKRFFARRRLPIILAPRRFNHFHLFYQTEHSPNPDSRLLLIPERDSLGLRRIQAKIRFSELDFRTVKELHRILRSRFASSGSGVFHYEDGELEAKLLEETHKFNSNAHHIGTTRMHSDPRQGVVDPNGNVHLVRNLYVAGSSVFPTGGHANPTLTIVALALRLADHLQKALR